MESKRQQKYGKLIQKELAEIFQRDTKSLFGNAFITVTEVKMSADLSIAKVFLSFLVVENKAEILKRIQTEKSKIRNFLGGKIGKQVRVIPQLTFYLDDSSEHAAKMEALFAKIQKPPSVDEGQDQTDIN